MSPLSDVITWLLAALLHVYLTNQLAPIGLHMPLDAPSSRPIPINYHQSLYTYSVRVVLHLDAKFRAPRGD